MKRTVTPMPLRARHDERGAAFIQVGIAIFVLVAMTAFSLDFGVMWLARRQAQNAADAGALAGAIARAYDETDDPPAADGLAYQSAVAAAQRNLVFSEVGGIRVTWDCPTYAAGGRCVRVDVHRDGTDVDGDGTSDSNSLPVFFASLFGVSDQPVRATATAWVGSGNSTNCMRPFAVADRWDDIVEPELNPKQFQRWEKVGPNAVERNPKDTYTPPSFNNPGTGYTVEDHLGEQVVLKGGNNPQSVADSVSPGWTLPIQLPDGEGGYVSGANDYSDAIKYCIGNPVTIGDYLPTETGVMVGPTAQGTETDDDSLINQDPDAEWVDGGITGSCAPGCAEYSPRIVPIAIFDMDEYQWRTASNNWTTDWIPGVGPGTGTFACPIGGRCVRVVNIIGFFVERMQSQDVFGRVVLYPGDFQTGESSVDNSAAFLTTIQLIR
jgi:hypothetical protein